MAQIASTWITTRLEGDRLRATVSASAEYEVHGITRTAAFAVEVPEKDLGPLQKTLSTLLKAYGPTAERRAEMASLRAQEHAETVDLPPDAEGDAEEEDR